MFINVVCYSNEKDYNEFSVSLTNNLRNQIKHMRMMKQFLKTCASEAIVTDKTADEMDLIPGGLGLKFDFPGDPKKLKEKSKMKLWKKYFLGNQKKRREKHSR